MLWLSFWPFHQRFEMCIISPMFCHNYLWLYTFLFCLIIPPSLVKHQKFQWYLFHVPSAATDGQHLGSQYRFFEWHQIQKCITHVTSTTMVQSGMQCYESTLWHHGSSVWYACAPPNRKVSPQHSNNYQKLSKCCIIFWSAKIIELYQ